VQNDKDHAKIFKKLQKLWGLVNSMDKGGNNESAMITKHPYGNISCLACDNGVHRRALEHWPEADGRIARVGGGYARAALMNSATRASGGTSAAKTRPMSATSHKIVMPSKNGTPYSLWK